MVDGCKWAGEWFFCTTFATKRCPRSGQGNGFRIGKKWKKRVLYPKPCNITILFFSKGSSTRNHINIPMPFLFPRKFQKKIPKVSRFLLFPLPADPVTHHQSSQPRGQGQGTRPPLVPSHVGPTSGCERRRRGCCPGASWVRWRCRWLGWLVFRNFLPSQTSAETPGDVSPKNVAKVKNRLLGVLFLGCVAKVLR